MKKRRQKLHALLRDVFGPKTGNNASDVRYPTYGLLIPINVTVARREALGERTTVVSPACGALAESIAHWGWRPPRCR